MDRDYTEIIVSFQEKHSVTGIDFYGKKNLDKSFEDTFLEEANNISKKYGLRNRIEIKHWLEKVDACVLRWKKDNKNVEEDVKKGISALNYVISVGPNTLHKRIPYYSTYSDSEIETAIISSDMILVPDYVERKEHWELVIKYRNKGTLSEGPQGILYCYGYPIYANVVNSEIDTDLGKMKYYGKYGKDVKNCSEPSGWNHANPEEIKHSWQVKEIENMIYKF